jgi:hypothetical protein
LEDELVRCPNTLNAVDITEQAAVGVMALLIHHLAGRTISSVLSIGTGADYLLKLSSDETIRVECSGVRDDPNGYETTARIKQKTEQLLSKGNEGYVSVTAFRHKVAEEVFSHLHYVIGSGTNAKKRLKGKKKPKKKK